MFLFSRKKSYQNDELFFLGFEKVLKMQASVINYALSVSECTPHVNSVNSSFPNTERGVLFLCPRFLPDGRQVFKDHEASWLNCFCCRDIIRFYLFFNHTRGLPLSGSSNVGFPIL